MVVEIKIDEATSLIQRVEITASSSSLQTSLPLSHRRRRELSTAEKRDRVSRKQQPQGPLPTRPLPSTNGVIQQAHQLQRG